MQERTFAYLISEDGGKHWRQVGWVGEAEKDKIIERQVAAGNKAGVADDIGRIRYKFQYRFVDVDANQEGRS